MLSFIYRLITRVCRRDEVTLDMIGTFEEGRAEAQSRGRWSYVMFGARELSGLLGWAFRMPKTSWTLIAGGGLAGLGLGFVASYLWPTSYTAKIQLRIEPSRIERSLLLRIDAFDLDRGVSDAKAATFSRRALTELAERGFYRRLSAEKRDGALREEMDKALRVERSGNIIRVSFTYRDYPPSVEDARKAAELANDYADAMIDQNLRRQEIQITGTVEFFKTRAQKAVMAWETINTQIRGLTAADPRFDRLALDRELARKEYESAREKLGEAEVMEDLAIRQRAEKLQVLDPAHPPEGPDVSRSQVELCGLGCGILAGLIAWLLRGMRGGPSVLLAAEAASSD